MWKKNVKGIFFHLFHILFVYVLALRKCFQFHLQKTWGQTDMADEVWREGKPIQRRGDAEGAWLVLTLWQDLSGDLFLFFDFKRILQFRFVYLA